MSYARSTLVILLVIVGAVLALAANATVWANRTVFNTDNFVETTNRVLDDEEVQQQLATRLSVTLVEQGQVEERLREQLPEGLTFLAAPLTNTARDLAHEAIVRLLNNERARDTLNASLRLVHEQVMKIIQDEGAVVVEGGKVILDLQVILEQAAERLGLNLSGRIELPPDAGQIVLIEDAETASTIQQLLSLHDTITWAVILGAVAALAAAVLIAKDRRATLRNVGIVLVACGVLAIVTLVGVRPIAASFAQNGSAARAAFDAFFLGYRIQSLSLLVIGGGLIVIAMLLGQGAIAVAIRGTVRRPAGQPAPDLAEAVRASATPLRVFGLVAGALLLAAWPDPSTRVYVTTFIVLGLYFGALWTITSSSDLAARARAQAGSAWGRVSSPDDERNATFIGQHTNQFRIAGLVLAGIALIAVPNLGIGALAGIVALTLVYMALVDWLSTKEA